MIMFIKFIYGNVATSSKGYVESVQYLKEAGWADGGRVIACTQPRRLAVQVQDGFVSFIAIDKHQKCFIVRLRLLTSPGTPLVPSSDGREAQPSLVTAKSGTSFKLSSVSKLHLSVAQSESNYPSRPARSSLVTRPSISTTPQYTIYSSRNTNILNTSSASVSSYIRPSTPTTSDT
ncbi:hypothetical protein Tco_0910676 [Tanacetum coccineum]|uniref:Uncharacterized protein n=1 Tax=Tanacetum coccineum TaxID=301880 RepID=A0ABQ5CTJ6_9ASTR